MSLELRSVSRRFGAQLALDRVSLHVRDGDCYGFIGHNGAGKTTAMRILLGLQRPDGGAVLVDGFDARAHPREARARMGALIETPGFQPDRDGARNLRELARLQGLSRRDAALEAQRWIERVGLAHARAKPVAAYSQGMRQRLGIAQALLGSPRHVLLDEPTNGLDPEGIAEMRALLASLHAEGITVLVSSHQLHELSGICNRIGVLKAGRLVVESETARLTSATSARYRLAAGDPARARATLERLGVARIEDAREGHLIVEPGLLAPERIPRALIEAGLDVSAFAEDKPTLEEIYLRFQSGAATDTGQTVPVASADVARAVDAQPDRRAPRAAVRRMSAFDLRRLGSSFGVCALLTVPAAFGAIAMARRATEGAADAGQVEGGTLFSATDVTAFEATGLALQAGLPVLLFLALGLGSQSIAAEYARGTLRNVLLRPLRRVDAALGKALALLCLVFGGYLLLVLVALAVGGGWFEFRDVTETLPNGATFTLTPAAELWGPWRQALVSPLLPLAAYTLLGFLAGACARSGAAALAAALSLGVLLDLGRTLTRATGWRGVLPSDYVPSPLSDTSFVRYFVDVAQGVSNARFEQAEWAVLVPALWAVGALAVATYFLVRRPIP